MGSNLDVKKQFPNHPFVKPYELWQWLAEATIPEGGTVCDPFSGVGSGTIGLLKKGYHVIACEINKNHYNHQLANIQNFYINTIKGKVTFI